MNLEQSTLRGEGSDLRPPSASPSPLGEGARCAVSEKREPRSPRFLLLRFPGAFQKDANTGSRLHVFQSGFTSLPLQRGRAIQTLFALIALTLTSCSPNANSPDLHSRIFSNAEIIGTRGTGLGQFTKPRSLALDRDDNLFVVDMTGRVQKFSPRGEILSSWRMPETDLGKPKGMCRDTNGNIVIVEPHYQRVNHFAPDGRLVEQWGSHGTNLGQLVLPRSVAVSSHGDIFVSEYTTVDRVQGFSALGRKPIVAFGQPGTGDGEFNRAEGLDVDARDRIYVADSCNHRIQIFSRDGKWLKTYGKAGRGLGELSYPYDVRVDRAGRQYVCEFGNSRIQVFGTNNEPIEILGGPGVRPGQFNNPWAIAFDSHGNLFVADAGNHRVQKLVAAQKHSALNRNPNLTLASQVSEEPGSGLGARSREER